MGSTRMARRAGNHLSGTINPALGLFLRGTSPRIDRKQLASWYLIADV